MFVTMATWIRFSKVILQNIRTFDPSVTMPLICRTVGNTADSPQPWGGTYSSNVIHARNIV